MRRSGEDRGGDRSARRDEDRLSQILHKSDAGGVVVGLKTEEEVTKAFTRIMTNAKNYDPRRFSRGPGPEDGRAGDEVILG